MFLYWSLGILISNQTEQGGVLSLVYLVCQFRMHPHFAPFCIMGCVFVRNTKVRNTEVLTEVEHLLNMSLSLCLDVFFFFYALGCGPHRQRTPRGEFHAGGGHPSSGGSYFPPGVLRHHHSARVSW